MNKNQTLKFEDVKLNVRIKLMVLWIALMLLYIYADIFSFYKPGHINEVIAGFMGPIAVDQMALVFSGILMVIPVFVVITCLFINTRAVRWINIITGVLYTFVGIGNLIGETWAYYLIYGVVEILVTMLIIITAFKWKS